MEYYAVHVVTESCDHYNFLMYTDDVTETLKAELGEEFAYIIDYWISTLSRNCIMIPELGNAIEQAREQEEDY